MNRIKLVIYNLYSQIFRTNKYDGVMLNVPVERLWYYPDLDRMYMTVAYRGDVASKTATFLVPEHLHKVAMSHASTGRRIMFLVTRDTGTLGFIFFGEESHLEIKRQIDKGIRPKGWGDPNSQDWEIWKSAQRKLKHSDIGDDWWGFARIMKGVPPEITILEG